MAGRDDPYRPDGPEDENTSRPARRHATRPARPAWDALTYGRPDDTRRPISTPPPDEPSYRSPPPDEPSYRSRPADEPSYRSRPAEPEPDWTRMYGAAPAASPPPPPAPTYPAAPAYPQSNPASSYPAATDGYAAAADTYAPDTYTSYRAAPAPPPASVGDEGEPVYVASGLYLDQPPAPAPPAPAGPQTGEPRPPGGDAGPYPGGLDEEPARKKSGRNIPAAIGVGLGLGAVVLGTLFLWRPAFLGVVAAGIGIGIWELVRALRLTGANPPLLPLLGGGVLMTGLAWWGGPAGLTFGLVVTVVAVMVWRFANGAVGYGADVTMAGLVAVYVPFLGGFVAMLASPEDGQLRVLAMLIAVVLSDTGGYVVGSRFGRHAMAPSVSPKKSWEGLGGSLTAAALGSGVVLLLMFGVAVWWGLLFGLAVAVASVVGDLGESMVKRALGVKDMSGLLPGHGGVMDRVDSVLLAAPVGYVLLSVIAPVA